MRDPGRDRETGMSRVSERGAGMGIASGESFGQSPDTVSREELEILKARAETLNKQINEIRSRIREVEKGRKERGTRGMIKGFGAPHARARNRARGRDANIANIHVKMRAVKSFPIKNSQPAGGPGYESTSRRRPVRKAVVDMEKCIGCGICESYCLYGAIKIRDGVAKISEVVCTGCGNCVDVCPEQAIRILKKYG
jgi:ferredoxin